eukprot:12910635-Alexandrium_andersonii.AAC.1
MKATCEAQARQNPSLMRISGQPARTVAVLTGSTGRQIIHALWHMHDRREGAYELEAMQALGNLRIAHDTVDGIEHFLTQWCQQGWRSASRTSDMRRELLYKQVAQSTLLQPLMAVWSAGPPEL